MRRLSAFSRKTVQTVRGPEYTLPGADGERKGQSPIRTR